MKKVKLKIGFKIRMWIHKRHGIFPSWLIRFLDAYELYLHRKKSMKSSGVAMHTFSCNGEKYLVLSKFKPHYSTVCFKICDEDILNNKGVNSEEFHLAERFKEAYSEKELNKKQKSQDIGV